MTTKAFLFRAYFTFRVFFQALVRAKTDAEALAIIGNYRVVVAVLTGNAGHRDETDKTT